MIDKYNSSSINQLFVKILKITDRSLKILEGVTKSFSSTDKSITLNLPGDVDGEVITYTIPSMSNIISEINQVSKKIDDIKTNDILDHNDKLYNDISKFSEPDVAITSPTVNLNGNLIQNDITITDKLASVNIDLSKSINLFSKNIEITKFNIPKNDISTRLPDLLKSTVSYDNLVQVLSEQKVNYSIDRNIKFVNPIETKYSGEFIILGIDDQTDLYNKKYKVSTLQYKDKTTNNPSSVQLVVGDVLIKNYVDLYTVTSVETKYTDNVITDYVIGLSRDVAGDILMVNDILHISSPIKNNRSIDIQVLPKHYHIIFVKDISPNIGIKSSEYGYGIVIDSNSILISTPGGNITYDKYFDENLFDYQEYISGMMSDPKIPAISGLVPNSPKLIDTNFKVVRVNNHRKSDKLDETSPLLDKLTTYNSKLLSLEQYKSMKNTDLFNLKVSNVSESDPQYISIVNEIKNLETDIMNIKILISDTQNSLKSIESNISQSDIITPKYQIIGFWELPSPVKDNKNRLQEVIRFEYEYRYLDLTKNQNVSQNLEFKKLDGSTINAIFSNSNNKKTDIRKKQWDSIIKKYRWCDDNISENIQNITQLNIPIKPYEVVSIRVRSISEAGWPETEIVSDWSEQIFIKFPDEYITSDAKTDSKIDTLKSVNTENSYDNIIKSLYNEISELKNQVSQKILETGIYEHINLTLDVVNGVVPIKLKGAPVVDTLMVFNMGQGTILNPSTDYIVEANSVYIQTEYRNTLRVNNQLMFFYKSLKI